MTIRTLCITDVETQGLDPKQHACIEVAVALYDVPSASLVECYSSLIYAEANAAEAVNRISIEALHAAASATDVWARVGAMLPAHDAVFVAHRAEFDRSFYPADLAARLPWCCSKFDIAWPCSKLGDHLVNVALAHGVPVFDNHRALTDVMLLVKTFQRVAEGGARCRADAAAGDAAEGDLRSRRSQLRPGSERARQRARLRVAAGQARVDQAYAARRRGRAAVQGRGGAGVRLILLESPYAAPTPEGIQANVHYARLCMRHALSLGEAPFASHLLYTQPGILRDEDPAERAWGIEAGLLWGRRAEATVLYVDRGLSSGMKLGIERARKEKRPVEQRNLPGYEKHLAALLEQSVRAAP